MGSTCSSSALKKKDKTSIENGNQSGSNDHRRVSNISIESVAYSKETKVTEISATSAMSDAKIKNKKLANTETKAAETTKLAKSQHSQYVDNEMTSKNCATSLVSQHHSREIQHQDTDNNQASKSLNKCTSLNESSKETSDDANKHQTACSTNSNPNESSTPNRPTRNCYDAVFPLDTNRSHVILISNDRNELCVYNLKTRQPVRTLRNVNRPKNVELIDQYRAVVLCNRELNVYNLDEGKLITKLKGVMNQKMPFYGLHDQNYVVTLSRNRMYVNMINLETGNLEITYKVGEDRFLNSLLVSKNGKICVCGDETQKPFPLLVWNLSSRKLIYDLRIPNHEFVTALSSISNDGHFVVCVCREAQASESCNFIVVYDLQSGTLFKKWKPECSTVSITISSNDNCVINGLENKQIQVYDLSTGSIRHLLEGHESPVDKLKVADDGEFFLSYDSTSQNQTIRVWSLSTGTCIKTFTPDFTPSCCTLSPDGKLLILCPDDSLNVSVISLTENSNQDESDNNSIFGDPARQGLEIDLAS